MSVYTKEELMALSDGSFELLLSPSDFQQRELTFKNTKRRVTVAPEVESIIEAEWDKYSTSQIAQEKHDYLTVTQLFRFEEYQLHKKHIEISLSQTDYREVYGTNIQHPEVFMTYGNEHMGNALGICTTIEFTDNKLLTFQRSLSVLEMPNYYHLCAGHFERGKDTIERRADVTAAVRREINEELRIPNDMILQITPIGLCRSLTSYKPELLFRSAINMPSTEFNTDGLNFEHKQSFIIEKYAVAEFLKEHRDKFVPSGKANLLCYLKSENRDDEVAVALSQ